MKKEMIIALIGGLLIFFICFFALKAVQTENTEGIKKESKIRKSDENLQLLCKITNNDDNCCISDWHKIEAYTSITQAIENPVFPEKKLNTEYDVHVALPDELKEVKTFYEICGKLLPVQVYKNIISKTFTKTFTIDYVGGKYHQSQYIVQIQCNKGTFFICIDNDYRFTHSYSTNIQEEPVYIATMNADFGYTINHIQSITSFSTLEETSKNPIHFDSGIAYHGLNMVFYCVSDEDLDIEIYDKKHNKPKSAIIKKEGNLSVFSLEEIAGLSKYNRNVNFLITFKYKGQKPRYLEIKSD